MAPMSGGAPTIQIPRWIQLVGLPVLALIAILLVGKVFHVVFLFLVAGLIALLLDPLVRALEQLRIPRGLLHCDRLPQLCRCAGRRRHRHRRDRQRPDAVGGKSDRRLPYERGRTASQTGFEQDVDRFQLWLDTHHLERMDIREQGQDFAANIKGQDVEKYTSKAIDFARGAAISIFQLVFSIVLFLVVSIYMLLDMGRLKRAVDQRFPPRPGQSGARRPDGAARSPATSAARCCCR